MSGTLASGTTLRHYCVSSLIGRGGMGEVYEARDLVLERRVALKVLSPELFGRPDRIRQFVEEAKKASALNHPHILTVHEIGEHDVNGDRIHFIAMELVEGVTLRQEIRQRRAPLRRLLNVMAQVADALAKAHDSGIVHRDLKPENVMVTADGYAKIIDFGLAKLIGPRIEAEGDAEVVTATQKGDLRGTIGYMAPEQIDQKEIDARADIFSFGCVLYEAVTGARAFDGESIVDVLYNICHQAPVPVEELAPDVPDPLPAIVERCLAKSPADRYHSMHDLALDLRGVLQRLSGDSRSLRRNGTGSVPLKRRRRVAWWWLGGAAAVVALAIAAVAVVLTRHKPPPTGTPVMRPLVRWPSNEKECRFSPDGAWVSFISNRDKQWGIWTRRTRSGEPTVLVTQPDRITSQVWSPSGDEIAYLTRELDGCVLHFVPAFGGAAPNRIALDNRLREGGLVRWVRESLYIESQTGLWRFDRASHGITKIADKESPAGDRKYFDVRADEKRITYSVLHGEQYQTVWIADIDGRHAVCLTPLGGPRRYSDFRSRFASAAGDDIVFSSDRSGQVDLWRVDAGGNAARQITFSQSVEWVQDVAAGGAAMAFSEDRRNSNLWLWDGRADGAHPLTGETASDLWPGVSAGGDLVTFQRTKSTLTRLSSHSDSDVYMARLSGGRLDEPRIAVGDASLPTLAPTGKWLTYVRPARPEQFELWIKDVQSDRAWRITDQLRLGSTYSFPVEQIEPGLAWGHGGEAVYFVTGIDAKRQEIRRLDPANGQSATLVRGDEGVELYGLCLSPDGRRLAYIRRSKGPRHRSDVVARDLVTGRESTLLSRNHGRGERFFCPGWKENGDLLVLLATVNPDWTERLQVALIAPDGRQTVAPVCDRGYGGTARFDSPSNSLILTTRDGDGFDSLSRVSLDERRTEAVIRNRQQGISFGGVVLLPDGAILFSRQEVNSDLWLIDFHNQ